jgi:hypothetical protein
VTSYTQYKWLGTFLLVATAVAQEPAQTPSPFTTPVAAASGNARQFSISYVESSRKWKFGPNSRTYDKISKDLQELMIPKLAAKGWAQADAPSGICCKVTIEIVEVSQHMAAFGKAGIDIVATVGIRNAVGKQVYSKAYRGESRSAGMHTWGGMVDMATKLLADAVFQDDDLLSAMAGPDASNEPGLATLQLERDISGIRLAWLRRCERLVHDKRFIGEPGHCC